MTMTGLYCFGTSTKAPQNTGSSLNSTLTLETSFNRVKFVIDAIETERHSVDFVIYSKGQSINIRLSVNTAAVAKYKSHRLLLFRFLPIVLR